MNIFFFRYSDIFTGLDFGFFFYIYMYYIPFENWPRFQKPYAKVYSKKY